MLDIADEGSELFIERASGQLVLGGTGIETATTVGAIREERGHETFVSSLTLTRPRVPHSSLFPCLVHREGTERIPR